MFKKRRKQTTKTNKPGLLMLQIDGLSRFQLERAIRSGKTPFLKRLLHSKACRMLSFYPGLPSCTPAVQAELFFGKDCATPAFSFFDRERQEEVRMYDAEWARRISKESEGEANGLLKGGASYANIYTGGASKAKFCGELNTFDHWRQELSPAKLIKRAFRYPRSAARVFKLILAEIGIGISDAFKGVLQRGELLPELKFIPARVGVAVALREAICGEIADDIKEGLPIVHANFFGYDEAAHRRGPSSRFAHWSLRGTDQAVKRIVKLAAKSEARDYEVIIFSDHGQESTVPYREFKGVDLKQTVGDCLRSESNYMLADNNPLYATMERVKCYWNDYDETAPKTNNHQRHEVFLQAMGPVAHLTGREEIPHEDRAFLAQKISKACSIPYILYLDTDSQIVCVENGEKQDLTTLQGALQKRHHKFAGETIDDLERLVRSKYAGDLVMLGWRAERKPITFAEERGAHAGPGAEECRGFVLLPNAIDCHKNWLRPRELRNLALHHLGRIEQNRLGPKVKKKRQELRILSYNVHGGVGVDRRRNADRLAAVIRESDAEVVCFQEAYEGRHSNRKSLRDAVEIAWDTHNFQFEFLPLHENDRYRYGLAIASKLPFEVRKSRNFELSHPRVDQREPRGAMWIEIEDHSTGRSIHIVNTHFGLQNLERRLQAQALTGSEWLESVQGSDRIVLCGDFNAGPKGSAYRTIARRYADSQLVAESGHPGPSFLSWAPVRRIDHIFTSPNLAVAKAGVHRSPLARWASDHLPVFADLSPHSL